MSVGTSGFDFDPDGNSCRIKLSREEFSRCTQGVGSQAFSDLERRGSLRPGVMPAVASRQLVALMDGLQLQWLLDNDSLDMAAELRAFLRAITTETF
jgi:hypothetical protein